MVVPKSEGEFIRKKLSELEMLRNDLKILAVGDILYIPVTHTEGLDLAFGTCDFEVAENPPASYHEIVDIPEELKVLLPTSYDIIGDICVIKLVDEVVPHAGSIGKAIVEAYKNIKVVLLDRGVRGELRTRNVRVIAGEDRTTTIHREYGLNIELDIAKMYFSPRLAAERKRVADMVKPGETIIDMFAGVGPFSMLIEKTSSPEIIHAIDLNDDAVEYMKRNIGRNRCSKIVPHSGDAGTVIHDLPVADRIIMNLPHSSEKFLTAALGKLKPKGTIHFYRILEHTDILFFKGELSEMATPHSIVFTGEREVHTYSPTQSLIAFDFFKE